MEKAKGDKVQGDSPFSYVRKLSRNIVSRSGDFNRILEVFENYASNLSPVNCVSQKLNLSPGIVLFAMLVLVLIVLVSKLGGSLICDAVGFLYPSYKSYKVLKQSDLLSKSSTENKDEEETKKLKSEVEENKKQLVYWTKYWVVFSLGFIFNYFANMFLYWLPFYYVAKLVFIVLLLHPKLQGAELIYNFVIAPILNRYEQKIDDAVVSIECTADQLLMKYGVEKVSDKLKEYAQSHTQQTH